MPQILNPGYAAVSELQDLLTQREVRKRQDFLDALEQKRVDAEIADHALNRKIQQENVDALAAQRKAAAVKTTADRLKPGQDITGTEAATTLPGDLTKTTGGATLPSTQISDAGRVASPSQPDASVPTTVEYTGTAEQRDEQARRERRAKSVAALPDRHRAFFQAKDDFGKMSAEEETVLRNLIIGPESEAIIDVDPRAGTVRQIGTAPKGAHVVTQPKPDATADGALRLSPQGLDMAAKLFAKTGQLPAMGMGPAGAAVRTAIINRAAQYDAKQDSFPTTPPPTPDIASNKSNYKADSGSQAAIQKNLDAVEAFAGTAQKNAALLKDLIAKVPDTGIPLLNAPIRALDAKLFGDENMAQLNAIRQSVQNEYARLLTQVGLSGALTDSARKEAEAILSGDATPKQMLATLHTLEQEAANRRGSYTDQLDAIKKRISGKAPGVIAPPTTPSSIKIGEFTVTVKQP